MSSTGRHSCSNASPRFGLAPVLARIPLVVRMVFYGAFFLTLALVALPWLAHRIDVRWPAWHIEIGPLRLVGAAVFALFLGLYLYASYRLSRHGRGGYVEFDPPQQFVSTGPYEWCRNPVAGCVVGMLLGEAVALSSTGILVLALVAMPLAHLQVVLLEEPLLRKRFGPAYEEYSRRVPRWLPRLRRSAAP